VTAARLNTGDASDSSATSSNASNAGNAVAGLMNSVESVAATAAEKKVRRVATTDEERGGGVWRSSEAVAAVGRMRLVARTATQRPRARPRAGAAMTAADPRDTACAIGAVVVAEQAAGSERALLTVTNAADDVADDVARVRF
jgi:hypothetical protein